MNNNELRSKSISSVMWSFIDSFGTQILQLVIQIVLARLLMPEDFGLIGMISVFIVISQAFIDSGFSKGLIRDNSSTQEDYSTVFLFNCGLSIVLYIVLFLTSKQIGVFFEQSELYKIIRIMSLVIVINSFGLIQRTLLIKELNFKTQSKVNLTSILVSGLVAILMGLNGFGVWSLVYQKLIMQSVQAVLYCLNKRWIPSLVFNVTSFKRLISFGWKILASTILTRVYDNIYYLIFGKLFSVTDLGYYTNAKKLENVASASLTKSVQKVSYPILSKMQDDKVLLRKGYVKIVKTTVYVTFPMMIGLLVIAPELIPVLLGEKWIDSVVFFQILSLRGMLYPLQAINLNILQVLGRTDLFLLVNTLKRSVGLFLLGIGYYLGFSMEAFMWIIVVNAVISYLFNVYYTKELIDYSMINQLKDISIYLVMSIVMASILYVLNFNFLGNTVLVLLSKTVIGIIIYVMLSVILKIRELRFIVNSVASVLRKVKKA